MRVGLYSETVRRAIVEVRTFIAERGYRATPEDIRKCRQDVLRSYNERNWTMVIELADFYSLSGCRDLLFNVMEHRFTIRRIKDFVNGQNLTFLGFDAEAWVMDKFEAQFGTAALIDLDCCLRRQKPTGVSVYVRIYVAQKLVTGRGAVANQWFDKDVSAGQDGA